MYGQGLNNQSDRPPPNPNAQPSQNANSFYANQHSQNPPHNQIPYQPQQQQPQQQQPYRPAQSTNFEQQAYAYQPHQPAPQPSPPQNGFFQPSSYTQEYSHDYADYPQDPIPQQQPQQQNFYNPAAYQTSSNASPPSTNHQPSPYSSNAYPPTMTSHSSPRTPRVPTPPITKHQSDYAHPNPVDHSSQQSSFMNITPQQYSHQQQQQPPPSQDPAASMQSAVPFMLAGMQQLSNANGGMNSALGAQLFNTLAPSAVGYTNQLFAQGQHSVRSFMRMPKYYFAVNHRYVLKKLALILMPFTQRIWARQRGMDPGHFEGSGSDGATSYLPPRDDVNAPDLYIPVMAFMTYVMMVGFVFGMRNAFQAEVLARYFSKGLAVLTLEVLIIKLGLYLINARPTPWLDVIAYRGYKFVGVVLTMGMGIVIPKFYFPAMLYSATAMGLFLMRSHRRIILPRDVDPSHAQDVARRNGFLLFVSVLQYPIYWILVLDVRS